MNSSGDFLNGSVRGSCGRGLLPLGKGGQASGQCRQTLAGSFGASEAEIHSWEKPHKPAAHPSAVRKNQTRCLNTRWTSLHGFARHTYILARWFEKRRPIIKATRNLQCRKICRHSNSAPVAEPRNKQTIVSEPSP